MNKKIRKHVLYPLIAVIGFFIILQILFRIFIPKSECYKELVNFLNHNEIVKNEIGEIKKLKLPIIISFEYNKGAVHGYAALTIIIYGEKGKAMVRADLKRYFEWEVVQAVLEKKDKMIYLVKNEPK